MFEEEKVNLKEKQAQLEKREKYFAQQEPGFSKDMDFTAAFQGKDFKESFAKSAPKDHHTFADNTADYPKYLAERGMEYRDEP